MKILLPFAAAVLLVACADKKVTMNADQSIFLTPEVMCGTVEFKDGCGPKTDTLIRFGLALIHHMTYEDAAYTFDQVIAADPDCFWGHWGKAMTYIHPLWPDQPTPEQMESGYVLSQRALSLAKKPNEKLYGEALAAYFVKSDKTKPQRLIDWEQGWAKAHEGLPDDPEAALFHGLSRLAITSPNDKTLATQKEVGAMAEALLEKYPDHPGAYHYAIHAYDVPPLADKALHVARNYGKIAPQIPHALHMPSHIFTRLGYWQESIDWNTKSAQASLQRPMNGQVSHHAFHAFDYMTYAYLQFGQDEKAGEIWKGIDTITAPLSAAPATAYSIAAIPARIALENQMWDDAVKIKLPDSAKFYLPKYPQYEALVYFARGIGGARGGNMEAATAAAHELERVHTQFGDAPEIKYWKDQVNTQRLAVNAWIALAKGNKDEALTLMKESAALEEATQKNPISPGELLPAGELLGDMFSELGMYEEAVAAYAKSLESRPNRFNSLYGAGKAAEEAGKDDLAVEYFTKLSELKGETPSTRERAKYAMSRSAMN